MLEKVPPRGSPLGGHFFCAILLIDFQRRAHGWWARNFPLYHTASNLSSKECEKNTQIIFPEFVQHYYLHFEGWYGILSLSRGNANWGVNVTPDRRSSTDNIRAKKSWKNFDFPLDNPLKVWYNKGVKGRWKPLPSCGSSGERNRKKCKKPLDKLPNLCYNKGTKGEGRSQKASPTRDE